MMTDTELVDLRTEVRYLRYAIASLILQEGGPITISRTELRDLRPDIALDVADDPASNSVVFRLVAVVPETGAIVPL